MRSLFLIVAHSIPVDGLGRRRGVAGKTTVLTRAASLAAAKKAAESTLGYPWVAIDAARVPERGVSQ